MKKITKKKVVKAVQGPMGPKGPALTEEQLCKQFQQHLADVKQQQANRHSKIQFYQAVGLLSFASLIVAQAYHANYATCLCLIPDVWAMYKLFRMM